MHIFFTASVRGGRKQQPIYEAIIAALGQYGKVSTQHISTDTLTQFGETHLTAQAIYERELALLKDVDCVVAEVSTPSLGVGYLIAQALQFGKPVYALYQGKNAFLLSAVVSGAPGVTVLLYEDKASLSTCLNGVLA